MIFMRTLLYTATSLVVERFVENMWLGCCYDKVLPVKSAKGVAISFEIPTSARPVPVVEDLKTTIKSLEEMSDDLPAEGLVHTGSSMWAIVSCKFPHNILQVCF